MATKNPASPPAPNPRRRRKHRNEPPPQPTRGRKPASREFSRSPPLLPPPSARAPGSLCSARARLPQSSRPHAARAATPPQTPPVPHSHAPPPPEPAKRSSLRHRRLHLSPQRPRFGSPVEPLAPQTVYPRVSHSHEFPCSPRPLGAPCLPEVADVGLRKPAPWNFHPSRHSRTRPEQSSPNPHQRRPFFNGNLKIARHAHRKLRKIQPRIIPRQPFP